MAGTSNPEHTPSPQPDPDRTRCQTCPVLALHLRLLAELQAAFAPSSTPSARLEQLAPRSAPVHLTAREWDVLPLRAAGKTVKAVAAKLSIAPSTVKRHIEHLRRKLEVTTAAEMAVWHTLHRHEQPEPTGESEQRPEQPQPTGQTAQRPTKNGPNGQ